MGQEPVSPRQLPDLAPISGADPQALFLASAAVIGIGEIGGRIPAILEIEDPACPAESSVYLPEAAVGQLKRMLAGEFELLLPEFLDLTASRGFLAPPELLPVLLGIGKADIRQKALQIVGRRGEWLARHNPAWGFAVSRLPQDAWEHGSFAERLAALGQQRAAQPDEARGWVEDTWGQDSPEQQAAFIAALEPGLSMADETLLEICLDDRRKEVRQAARTLLLRLEQSHLALRSWERARRLVKKKFKLLGGDQIEVVLPAEVNTAGRRDGIGERQVQKTLGEKADLLVQIISLVPPQYWNRNLDARLQNTPGSHELRLARGACLGLANGCCLCSGFEWAAALVALWAERGEIQKITDQDGLTALAQLLKVESVEALVAQAVRPHITELDDRHKLVTLLTRYQQPWSANLARMVIKSAQRQSLNAPNDLAYALHGFGRWVPPELAEEFSEGWGEDLHIGWSVPINRFLGLLKFRQEIR
ncbi:MAG: hypothetical protein IPN59_13600 [Holophaga sp.]|nr:hypothetical protein [Holophaga sp.]